MENSRLEVLSSDFPLCLGQVLDLQRDVGVLRQDLEAANTKLASSMNSIKTFWSPELKKERSMRRDELQKLTTCKEELAKAQEATLKQAETIAKLEAELEERQSVVDRAAEVEEKRAGRLATVKKLQAQLGKEEGEHEGDGSATSSKDSKELFILRKTLAELELRIDTQKRTLAARDESVRRLLEMLQVQGILTPAHIEKLDADRRDAEGLRVRLVEEEAARKKMESDLKAKEQESQKLKQELAVNLERLLQLQADYDGLSSTASQNADTPSSSTLLAILENKEKTISSLESRVDLLQEEVSAMREDCGFGKAKEMPRVGIGSVPDLVDNGNAFKTM